MCATSDIITSFNKSITLPRAGHSSTKMTTIYDQSDIAKMRKAVESRQSMANIAKKPILRIFTGDSPYA